MTPNPNGRYAGLPTRTLVEPDGRVVAYLTRRFLPNPDPRAPAVEHRVRAGERLDLIAATYLGDPELFWWVADASRAMNPDDLTAPPDAGGPPRTVLVPQIGG